MKSADVIRIRCLRKLLSYSILITLLFTSWNCVSASISSSTELPVLQPSIQISSRQANRLKKKFGIEIMSLRLSSAGYMVDFRYRILDTEKSKYLMQEDLQPYIIDPETSRKFFVPSHPKVGSMRAISSEPKQGRSYFIMFANTDRLLKTGKKITIVLGDLKIANLTVQ